MLHLAQGSREATLSTDREEMSDVAVHCTQQGIKGSNERRKQCLQGTTTTAYHDDGYNWKVGDSGARCTLAATRNDKCLARLPMDHFKRLLEVACTNHTNLVRHKLKDSGMMRSFMTLGSLTCGAELDEGVDGSDTMLFPEENVIAMVYGGHPPSGRHRVTSLSPRTPTHYGWGRGGSEV
jgi:hypothetical protein